MTDIITGSGKDKEMQESEQTLAFKKVGADLLSHYFTALDTLRDYVMDKKGMEKNEMNSIKEVTKVEKFGNELEVIEKCHLKIAQEYPDIALMHILTASQAQKINKKLHDSKVLYTPSAMEKDLEALGKLIQKSPAPNTNQTAEKVNPSALGTVNLERVKITGSTIAAPSTFKGLAVGQSVAKPATTGAFDSVSEMMEDAGKHFIELNYKFVKVGKDAAAWMFGN